MARNCFSWLTHLRRTRTWCLAVCWRRPWARSGCGRSGRRRCPCASPQKTGGSCAAARSGWTGSAHPGGEEHWICKKTMKLESRSNYLSLQLLQHSLSEVVLPMVLLVLLLLLEQERRHRRVRVRRSLRPRGVPRRLPGEGTLQHPLLPLKEASHRLFALLLLTRVVIGDAAEAAL